MADTTGKLTKKVVETAPLRDRPYFLWEGGDGAVKGFGVAIHPTGKRVFVAQFRIGKGRAAKSRRATIGAFGTYTVEQARDRARNLIQEGRAGVDAIAVRKAEAAALEAAQAAGEKERRQARDLRVARLAARYLRQYVRPKKKPNTVAIYRHAIAAHILPALGRKDAREVTRQDVSQLHLSMQRRPAMANRVVATLSAIYGWAEREGILPEGYLSPTRHIEAYREKVHERYLSVDELARLGEAIRVAETAGVEWSPRAGASAKHAPKAENRLVKIDRYSAAALRLLIFTGARLREILHLEWSDVDLDRGLLRLRDSKPGPKTILINPPARAVLVALPRKGRFVIRGESDSPRADLKRPWALVCRAAKLPGLRLHDLRHSFASVGAGDGHGLIIVGKLLGHSQARTTERYAHLDNDPLRKASDAIASKIAQAMGEAPRADTAEIIPLKRTS